MGEDTDQDDIKKLIESFPDQAGIEAFSSDEMIVCASCKRNNPPNRLECLYCGVNLEITEEQSRQIKPALRKIEGWKNGVNLIYISDGHSWDDAQVSSASKMTRLDAQVLTQIADTGKSLPLARVESEAELEIVRQRFSEIAINTILFEDKAFDLDSVSTRLRAIEFKGEKLTLTPFNVGDTIEVDRSDIYLVVVGALFEKKIESTENYKKNGDNKILETVEMSADQMLIDIYTKENQISYRIEANGFDFSFLGAEKALIVNENMKLLLEKLKLVAPDIVFDDDYLRVRGFLGQVWEVEEKADSKGIHRKGFGRFNKEQTLMSDNLEQFNKYSRLQWHLLNK